MSDSLDVLRAALPLIESYLKQNADPAVPVVNYVEAKALRERLDLSLPDEGTTVEALLPLLESYLHYGVRTGHRHFLNQLYGGFDTAGFLGDVVSSLTNTSMYTYEVAPVATLMELELIDKLGRLIGFRDPDGIFCPGGSNANMLGLLCARDRAFPDIRTRGLSGRERPVLFVSDQAHYSFNKAANQLGIGTDHVIEVDTDADGRMLPEKLDEAIRAGRQRGETPFFVGATAGTTVLGAFDPLREIAEICRQYGLWLHVDGSWGGPVLLSEKHRHLLDGSELADSLSWDAHKIMGASLTCAAVLTRHRGVLRRACSSGTGDADYLFHASDDAGLDLGKKSLQCGRRVDALRFWLMWRRHGSRGFGERIDRSFELARLATGQVLDHPRLELVVPTRALNVCFRYLPEDGQDADRLNLEIRERLRKTGKTFFNYAHHSGNVVLRLVFPNPETNDDDVRAFFDSVVTLGAELAGQPLTRV